MEKIILEVAGIITSITVIITAVNKIFVKKLEPINKKMDYLDKNHCKDFLSEFLEDKKNGKPIDDVREKRAYEVYDHYTNDLNGNSYIHDSWEKLMKKGGN